jgi:hypothetical protein
MLATNSNSIYLWEDNTLVYLTFNAETVLANQHFAERPLDDLLAWVSAGNSSPGHSFGPTDMVLLDHLASKPGSRSSPLIPTFI